MTRRGLLIGILAASAIQAHAAQNLPEELVGEWATEKSEFNRGALAKGVAIYLWPQGAGALIGAPPPVGAMGPATYDAITRTLTLRLMQQGRDPATCDFIYDHRAKTLTAQDAECGPDVFKRRRDSVPDYVPRMLR